MKLNQIINSLLETDLYKFSMGQAIYHQFPSYKTNWTFKCRNKGVKFTKEMVEEIRENVQAYCALRFTDDELKYLSKIEWLHEDYLDHLQIWKPRYEDFTITDEGECGFTLEANGTWLNTSMYEIPVLAIINEVYFRMAYNYDELFVQYKRKLEEKKNWLIEGKYNIGTFSEFGLRRRLSAEAQDLAVKTLCENNKNYKDSRCVGTSNVYLAKKYNVVPVGTMAHEYIMCAGQGNPLYNPAYSNKILFSGVRHDSGDPYEWGEEWIKHYDKLYQKYHDERVNPKTKTLLFSDSLDFERASALYAYFKDRIKVAFGIGTYIANDTDVEPLNIVMKVTECNDQPVAKLSNSPGKTMCKDNDYVEYLRKTIDWRLKHYE